ncbi:hypothetical protein E3N88_20702 [Mikania micrantha]|uniref:Uncharacterized protein n=1 Tax=Mikania micrantha TaxID=192012 RepID=A0A5N6NIZ2_9ASTR|nr:hypothetical protein E3N88_20702 [Mikania micrantha]
MASSSNYKYQKDEKAIKILEKSSSDKKKDDRIMRNSIGMLNGLIIADIRSNISNLSELLDDNGEGAEEAKDYMVSQLMMNEEMHAGIDELLKVTIDKMKKKRDDQVELVLDYRSSMHLDGPCLIDSWQKLLSGCVKYGQ